MYQQHFYSETSRSRDSNTFIESVLDDSINYRARLQNI